MLHFHGCHSIQILNLAFLFSAPTPTPTVDTCDECTLTGLVSASKYNGDDDVAFLEAWTLL